MNQFLPPAQCENPSWISLTFSCPRPVGTHYPARFSSHCVSFALLCDFIEGCSLSLILLMQEKQSYLPVVT